MEKRETDDDGMMDERLWSLACETGQERLTHNSPMVVDVAVVADARQLSLLTNIIHIASLPFQLLQEKQHSNNDICADISALANVHLYWLINARES